MDIHAVLVAGLFASFLLALFSGFPVAFALGGTAVLFAVLGEILNGLGFWVDADLRTLGLAVNRLFGIVSNVNLVPIPLFVFMGIMLDRSGIAEDLLGTLAQVLRRAPGGLGLAVIVIGVVLAASTGIVGASVVLLATLALPTMLAAGYDARLSSGLVAATGTLGILVPPSIMLLVMADQMLLPVPDLFAAALVPGLLLAALYAVAVVAIGIARPRLVPAVPADGDTRALAVRLLVALAAPLAIIFAVLGSIAFGIASPAEAGGVGAFGAVVLAAARRRLSLTVLRDAVISTARTTSFIILLLFGATTFAVVLRGLGGDELVASLVLGISEDPTVIIAVLLAVIFVLGFVLDWIEITLIVLPIVQPILEHLGIDLLWFTVLVAVCLQTSFLTPPVGGALFFLKSCAPPGVGLVTIYRGVVPFIVLQLIGLCLLLVWPQIALWLPGTLAR